MAALHYIYRNLHYDNAFSVLYRGLVVDRLSEFVAHEVVFKVSPAGRARVLREKRKNVHAYVAAKSYTSISYKVDGLSQITYNPYINENFIVNGQPILEASGVVFANGKCYLVEV